MTIHLRLFSMINRANSRIRSSRGSFAKELQMLVFCRPIAFEKPRERSRPLSVISSSDQLLPVVTPRSATRSCWRHIQPDRGQSFRRANCQLLRLAGWPWYAASIASGVRSEAPSIVCSIRTIPHSEERSNAIFARSCCYWPWICENAKPRAALGAVS